MHKSIITDPPKRVRRKRLKRAFRYLRNLGLQYHGRAVFWGQQTKILAAYLQDPQTDSRIVNTIHKFLRKLGVAGRHLPDKVYGAYNCSRLGITIHQPCQERLCPFWGDFETKLNCVLHYLGEQNRDNLSVAEMGIMSGFSRVHVNNILSSSLDKIRQYSMKDLKEDEFEPKMETVRLDGMCVACGKETTNPAGHIKSENDTAGPYTYCSFDCYVDKPPSMVFLESALEVPVSEVLLALPKRYADIMDASSCLTLNEKTLTSILLSKAPGHVFLECLDQPRIETRMNGKKTWERRSRQMSERIEALKTASPPLLAN